MHQNKKEKVQDNSVERSNIDGSRLNRLRQRFARWGLGQTVELTQSRGLGETIKQQHYVKEAPRFKELLDEEREGTIQFVRSNTEKLASPIGETDEVVETSEQEAIRQTIEFLEIYQQTVEGSDNEDSQRLSATAHNLLENMTYIGHEELDEATTGLAEYWKTYLTDEEAHIILWSKEGKSSRYVRDAILQKFDSQKDASYLERIHDIEQMYMRSKEDMPAKYKVIMVDDWTATGRQLSRAYGQDITRGHKPEVGAEFEANTEINLIAAQEAAITNGFMATDGAWREEPIPLYSYFKVGHQDATDVMNGTRQLGVLITGAHSSTDDGFEIPIAQMVKDLRENYGKDVVMPPLTNIIRSYR